jgi:hypothetical protein
MPSEDDLVVLEKGEWVSENGVFHLDSDFSSGMLLYNITHTHYQLLRYPIFKQTNINVLNE